MSAKLVRDNLIKIECDESIDNKSRKKSQYSLTIGDVELITGEGIYESDPSNSHVEAYLW